MKTSIMPPISLSQILLLPPPPPTLSPKPDLLRRLLYNSERQEGVYSITISFLRLVHTLAFHALTTTPNNVPGFVGWDGLGVCLRYITHDIFADYDSWKYATVSDKYQIGQLVLQIFKLVLTTKSGQAPPALQTQLRRSLLVDLLQDSTIVKSLLSIIAKGYESIDRLYVMRKHSEAKARIQVCAHSS